MSKRTVVSAQKYKGAGCRLCINKECSAKIMKCSKVLTELKKSIKGKDIILKKK